MNTVHTSEHAGCTVKIVQDDHAENPLTCYEDFIKVVSWGHDVGNCHDFHTPQAFDYWCNRNRVTRLPLYLLDHSGLRVNTTGFGCPWDSGQVGWVYVDHAEARKGMNWARVSLRRQEELLRQMDSTVEILDNYLSGNNYGFIIEHNGKEVDSCWGFTCEPDGYVLDEAKCAAESVPYVQLPLAI